MFLEKIQNRFRNRRQHPLFFVLSGIGAVVLLVAFLLAQSYWFYCKSAARDAENLALSLEQYVSAEIAATEKVLEQTAAEFSALQQSKPFSDDLFEQRLSKLAKHLPAGAEIRAASKDGKLIYGPGTNKLKPVDVSDREWFTRTLDVKGMTIAFPIFGRITSQWHLPVARRLVGADGEVAGAAIVTLPIESMQRVFASLDLGKRGVVTIFHEDRSVLVRHPDPNGPGSAIGIKLRTPQFLALWDKGIKAGTYEAVSVVDGQNRVYSYRQVGQSPLYVIIGLSPDDYLAPWYRELWVSIVFIVFLIVLMLVFVLLMARSDQELAQSMKSLRLESEKNRTLLCEASDGVHVLDEQGCLIEASDSFFSMLGYTRASFPGKSIDHWLVSMPHPEALALIKRILDAGQPYTFETDFRRKDGAVFPVEISTKPIELDGVRLLYTAARDVSERHQAEEYLRLAADRAEAANLAKTQFLATMSHELRTPLNAVLGMAQLLMLPDLTDEEKQEYVQSIYEGGNTLLVLLNDILDLSSIDSGRLNLSIEDFYPREMLARIVQLFGPSAKARHLDFSAHWESEEDFVLRGDGHRLQQMVANLVSNALKFTEAGVVRVSGRSFRPINDRVVIEFRVSDTGIGIPPDKKDRLFQPFSQLDGSVTRKYGGSGLGLSIVKNLAEQMGGSVGFESAEGEGASFWFRVSLECSSSGQGDLSKMPGLARLTQARETDAQSSGRILIVEDNPLNRTVVQTMLEKHRYDVVCVFDGQAALNLVKAGEEFDVILMDCQMPVMDGVTATKYIRSFEISHDRSLTPIIALTADAFPQDRLRCIEAGMNSFIAKPVDQTLLLSVIASFKSD